MRLTLKKCSLYSCALICLLLAGCSSIYYGDIRGPNGYVIACDKGRDCTVLDGEWGGGGTSIIDPEVALYAIVDRYIVGKSVPAKTLSGKPDPDEVRGTGFFIVDTQNHTSSVGLNEVLWRQQLTQLGFPIPTLQPTPFENKPPVGINNSSPGTGTRK